MWVCLARKHTFAIYHFNAFARFSDCIETHGINQLINMLIAYLTCFIVTQFHSLFKMCVIDKFVTDAGVVLYSSGCRSTSVSNFVFVLNMSLRSTSNREPRQLSGRGAYFRTRGTGFKPSHYSECDVSTIFLASSVGCRRNVCLSRMARQITIYSINKISYILYDIL